MCIEYSFTAVVDAYNTVQCVAKNITRQTLPFLRNDLTLHLNIFTIIYKVCFINFMYLMKIMLTCVELQKL